MKRIALSVTAVGVLVVAGVALVGAAPASASYRVGVGEQNPQMFDSPSWQSLKLKQVRYLVPWDYATHQDQIAHPLELERLPRGRIEHLRVLLAEADPVAGARGSGPDQGHPDNDEHAYGGNGQGDSFHRGLSDAGRFGHRVGGMLTNSWQIANNY